MRRVLVVLVVLVFVVGCSDNPTEPDPPKVVRQLTAAEQELVNSGNSFGLKLYHEIITQEPDTNLFISPLSVAMALGMTYNGARGETQAAMAEVLELQGMDLEEVNKSYQSLIALLRGLDDKVDFNLANSIWYRHDFTVESEFVNLNSTYFDALVQALDFGDPAAPGVINGWVDENTRGKIKKIVDVIPPEIVMYLINAIYFKADWSTQFKKDDTHDDLFQLADGSMVDCRMMTMTEEFAYFRGEDFKVIDLSYGDSLYSMTIILPDMNVGLDEFIAGIDQATLDSWLSQLAVEEVALSLPKFEHGYGIKLNDALKALGMEIAFAAGEADFSGINRDNELYIDAVMHKSYIKVDEEGTEAAAVTGISIGTTGAPLTSQFRADHPFIYMIREHHSGTILFIGQVAEPHWSE